MTDFSEYSLSGCLLDENFGDAPKLSFEGDSSAAGAMSSAASGNLPPRIDLRRFCSSVEDQQKTNSCVGNAVVGSLELLQRKSGHSSQDLSRLFLYYNARAMHGAQGVDKGTYVHLAMAALLATGVCEERMWPFSMVTINDPPTQGCYENAHNYRGTEFAAIERGTSLMPILAQEIPVVITVELPREAYLEAHKTGVMQIPPGLSSQGFQHGVHAMVVVGYDIEKKAYLVRNSWGTKFADQGYFHMPFAILDGTAQPGQLWAIGALNRAPGLKLLGQSVEQSVQGMITAAAPRMPQGNPATDALSKMLRTQFEGNIATSRKNFASKLRGQ